MAADLLSRVPEKAEFSREILSYELGQEGALRNMTFLPGLLALGWVGLATYSLVAAALASWWEGLLVGLLGAVVVVAALAYRWRVLSSLSASAVRDTTTGRAFPAGKVVQPSAHT
jgi:hypothetical protein